MGPDVGTETSYVHRLHWLPDLHWKPPAAARAASEVCRRYLAAFGPAEPRDLAFWLGSSIAQAREWLAGVDVESVDIDGIEHFCSSPDLDALLEQPPPPSRWPVRLLYRFDPLLLATRDKTWLVDAEHYKQVWRPAGHVEPVLLIGGRAAASWRYERKGGPMVFTVSVFPGRTLARSTRAAIEREAAKLAQFLEHDSAAVTYR